MNTGLKTGFPLTAVLLALGNTALAADLPGKSGMTLSAGTLGVGVEFEHSLPVLNLTGRLAWNGFRYNYSDTVNGNDYEMELGLQSISALVDWRPWGKITHFTAGVVSNGNEIDFTGNVAPTYMIGGTTFSADDVGTLQGKISFDKVVPYLGLGWNVPVAPRTAVSLELGVVFQGSPKLDLQADGLLADDPAFQAEMERERQQFEDDISDMKYYPVLSLGLQRRF